MLTDSTINSTIFGTFSELKKNVKNLIINTFYKYNPPNIKYDDIYGKNTIYLNVYDELDGKFYRILYRNHDCEQLYFSEISDRIVNDVISNHTKCRKLMGTLDGVHFVFDENCDNTIHVTNKNKIFQNGHVHTVCAMCVYV